jgi:hypothetical protein
MWRSRDAAQPARYGPEFGAARRAGRDDGRGPRVSDKGRGGVSRAGAGPKG